MADKQIGDLTAATTPLVGTETVHIVQSGNSRKAEARHFGSLVFLEPQIASNSASLSFTGVSSTYDEYEIHFNAVVPITDTAVLWVRINGDTGSNYRWEMCQTNSGSTTVSASVSASDTKVSTIVALGNSTGESVNGIIRIANVNNTSLYKNLVVDMTAYQSGPISQRIFGGGTWVSASAVTSISVLMSTGNISAGNFYLYGMRKS